MNVTLVKSEAEASNIRTFFFRPEKPVHYTAGQFIELTIPHRKPDNRGTRRWFTLSSAPTNELLTITTKFADDSPSTFKQALFSLQPGTKLHMSDPMGDFVLPKLLQTPLVFVAGGIGITPFHSMLSWLAEVKEQRDIQLIYGVRNEDEIIFQDTFHDAGIHATIIVSEASAAWGGEHGRINAELITGLETINEDALIYISGPEPMVESLHKDLKKAGIKANQLVGDYFPNYSAAY